MKPNDLDAQGLACLLLALALLPVVALAGAVGAVRRVVGG